MPKNERFLAKRGIVFFVFFMSVCRNSIAFKSGNAPRAALVDIHLNSGKRRKQIFTIVLQHFYRQKEHRRPLHRVSRQLDTRFVEHHTQHETLSVVNFASRNILFNFRLISALPILLGHFWVQMSSDLLISCQ